MRVESVVQTNEFKRVRLIQHAKAEQQLGKKRTMKKLALALVLAWGSFGAVAEWTLIDRGAATTYVDLATLQRSGDRVKMWILIDLTAVQTVPTFPPYSSYKVQYEYDCNETKKRGRYWTFHSGRMGDGDGFKVNLTGTWSPIPPGSVDETEWKIACGMK